MEIKDIFVKDITRPLNPVIKVNDLEDSVIYQELEEYIVTNDVDKNFEKLYKGIIKRYRDGGDKDHIGVWISGDFGSGKSHFLKIVSFLLQNKKVKDKSAVDYFLNKPGVSEPVLHMMQDIGRRNIDTILFDIDSRSTRSQSEDSLVQTFMGVFNEKVGLCFNPSVAALERFLQDNGRYEDFKSKYEFRTGKTWEQDRIRASFVKGKIADALIDCGAYVSHEEARAVADSISKESLVSVDEFANIVKQYCESKGPDYTLFFMVDEVGQFISGSVQKMLKLQTITERIGVKCNGQAWIVVTSQEDVEAVVSGVNNNDFSKIQGRFTTRIKMTSSDVKEVVEKRILLKIEEASTVLKAFYEANRTDIHNKLCMKNLAEIRLYNDPIEFSNTYPFIPYQYPMLQDLLTSLRNKSLSGKNLSQAARSMLRIFKETAEINAEKELDFITPLYSFFDAIQPELDTPMNLVFDNAKKNTKLNDFDMDVLKTLFLVKYYDKLDKNLDNVTALMVSSFNQNRIDLKKEVQESLTKLAKENYIQANADSYIFLTNEEQEISKDIKNTNVDFEIVRKDISDTAFGSVFHLTSGKLNGRQFNRFIDKENINHTDYELFVHILLSDDVQEIFLPNLSDKGILFKIPNGRDVENAFVDYLRTEEYLRKNETVMQTVSRKSILDGKRIEIVNMKGEAISKLNTALRAARIFVNKEETSISDSLPADKRLNEAFDMLVSSVYSKYDYIRQHKTSSNVEAFLKSATTETYDRNIVGMERAFSDLSSYLEERKGLNNNTTIKNVMDCFRKSPYGFETEDIQWMLSVLFRYGHIDLMFEGKVLKGINCKFDDAKKCLIVTRNQDKVRILLRQAVTRDQIERAADVLGVLFAKTVSPNEENVVRISNEYADTKIKEINSKLEIYADHPRYPRKEVLSDAVEIFEKLSNLSSPELFTYIDENEDILRGLNAELKDVYDFLKPDSARRKLFDRGLSTLDSCSDVRIYLDPLTKEKLEQIDSILDSGDFKRLPNLNRLCSEIDGSFEETTEKFKATYTDQVKKALVDNRPLFTGYPELIQELEQECEHMVEVINGCLSLKDVIIAYGGFQVRINALSQKIPRNPSQTMPDNKGTEAGVPRVATHKEYTIRSIYSEQKTIESEDDIEKVVDGLRKRMKEKLAEGSFDIIW